MVVVFSVLVGVCYEFRVHVMFAFRVFWTLLNGLGLPVRTNLSVFCFRVGCVMCLY